MGEICNWLNQVEWSRRVVLGRSAAILTKVTISFYRLVNFTTVLISPPPHAPTTISLCNCTSRCQPFPSSVALRVRVF